MIKLFNKLGIKGNCLNIIKAINKKPIANIIIHNDKTKSFSSKFRNKTRMPVFTTSM